MSYLLGGCFRVGGSSATLIAAGILKSTRARGISAIAATNQVGVSKKWDGQRLVVLSAPEKRVCPLGVLGGGQRRGMSGGGNHVTLWTAERILSGVLVPLLPLALITPAAPLDYLLAFTLVLHSHWGIEAIVVDYVRPSLFGEMIPKLAVAMVYGLSAMTLGGLFYFIYADVGIGQAIRLLWKL